MRIYAMLRGILLTHQDILLKLERLEKRTDKHDEHFKIIFDYLRELLTPKSEPSKRIGFRRNEEG